MVSLQSQKSTSSTLSLILVILISLFANVTSKEGTFFLGSQQESNIKSFLQEICNNTSSLMGLTVKSFGGERVDRNLDHLCTEGANGLLLWVTAESFDQAPDLDTKREYVGRAAALEEFNGYCKYSPVTKSCSNGHENRTSTIVVLGEKYPERYEIRDMVYKKWTNATRLGTPILAYATLKNREPTYKYVDQDISYLSDTRVEFQLPATIVHGLPLSVYRGKVETYRATAGETYYGRTFKTANAVRYMSPNTVINVTVTGLEERAYREFRAKLVTVYTEEEGHGWSRAIASIEGSAIETSLAEVNVEYGVVISEYEESYRPGAPTVAPNIPHTDHRYPGQPAVQAPSKPSQENIHIHIGDIEMSRVYPEFKNIALGASIVLFGALAIALLDITRRVISDRRAKRMGTGKYSRVNAN
ncbi:enolase-binding protein-like [Uranotaenia lowii]|uniref:enolase-binding protein-like n=1 Tax=Uranotaenia lowii TaxID=190385 RepID=UPI0024787949|nr:enolase-binding protein-like [Uranotaenia lowii]